MSKTVKAPKAATANKTIRAAKAKAVKPENVKVIDLDLEPEHELAAEQIQATKKRGHKGIPCTYEDREFESKTAMIRTLNQEGMTVNGIAKATGIRYQMVFNILGK